MITALTLAAALNAAAPAPAPAATAEPRPQPKIVTGGIPAPDPGLLKVGACVWAAQDASERERRVAGQTPFLFEPQTARQYVSPLASAALSDKDLLARVRACDPNLPRHWRYSLLAAASRVEQEVALARLAASRVDATKLETAWREAPQALRDGHRRMVEIYLDGPAEAPLPDWTPMDRALRLKRAAGGRAGALRPLTPVQAQVRDYFYARELEAVIVARMSATRTDPPAAGDVWVLDHEPDAERYYPARALDSGLGGRTATECKVTQEGALIGCVTTAEDPVDNGFGAASVRAITATYHFRMDDSPHPAPGTLVRIRLLWAPSE